MLSPNGQFFSVLKKITSFFPYKIRTSGKLNFIPLKPCSFNYENNSFLNIYE